MTEEQKSQIHYLKAQGQGYSKIARALGLSPNTVKTYLRRHPEASAEMAVCLCCKKPLQKRQKKFCSKACKNKWWNSHQNKLKGEKRKCPVCGKSFYYSPSKNQKFCSHECYIKHRFHQEACHEG